MMTTTINKETTMLVAYKNDPTLKENLLIELRKHYEADAIARGFYGQVSDNAVEFRGCAIGCTLHSLATIGSPVRDRDYDNHADYETLLGIPRAIARIEDGIFEHLPLEDAKEFPIQFATAIEPGADLSQVVAKFLLTILSDPDRGVINFAKTERSRSAIQAVINLYRKQLSGQLVSQQEWRAAAAAADDAAYAAYAYAYAAYAAAYAAYAAAAYAAAYADDAAAYAASAAYAYAAAKQNHYQWMRDVLLTLLRNAPVGEVVVSEKLL